MNSHPEPAARCPPGGPDLQGLKMTRHITAALVVALTMGGLSGCSVEWQNLQPAREMARQQSAQAGNLYAGWRLFQDRCAGCHGTDAGGQGNAPDLRARLRNLGPRSFASLVLNRYDWGLPGTPPASDTPARETWVDAVVQRQAGTVTMPAWRGEPGVSAHVMDLYAYLAARSEGTQGPGRPAP